MKDLDLPYLCRSIGGLCGFPVRLYEGGELVCKTDHSGLAYDPAEACREDLFRLEGPAAAYVTPRYSFYGLVRRGETRLILGPTRQVPASEPQLRELAFLIGVPGAETEEFIRAMRSLVAMPLESLEQILCTMNYVMNGEQFTLEDVAVIEPSERQIVSMPEIPEEDRITDGVVHNTLGVERMIMEMVETGDTAGLKSWISAAPAIRAGVMAGEQLRQYRNTFIVTATLAARAAIRGGMDAEEALSMSDILIRSCEAMNNIQSMLNLQTDMLLNYTERVERLRGGIRATPLALEVAGWVGKHLSEPVSVERLAEDLHYSRSHLSRRFREEAGVTLTDYILRKKSEEAARLIVGTGRSLVAIGDYLGFSSQSHFARVFKKYIGKSPAEYRSDSSVMDHNRRSCK